MKTMATYTVDKQILIAPELAFTIGVVVGNTGLSADSEGKKIIKAGTALGGATSPFATRNTELKAVASPSDAEGGTPAYGIALHDVDVTAGATSVAMLVDGYVDTDKLDVTITSTVSTYFKNRILFVKGDAQ